MCLGVPTKDKELTNLKVIILKVIIKDECFGEFYVYDSANCNGQLLSKNN
jgi:hypothetical protein